MIHRSCLTNEYTNTSHPLHFLWTMISSLLHLVLRTSQSMCILSLILFTGKRSLNDTLFFLHFISLEIIWSVLFSYRIQSNKFHHVHKSSSMTFTFWHRGFEDQAEQLSRAQSRDWSAVQKMRERGSYLIPTKSPYHSVRGVRAKFEFR